MSTATSESNKFFLDTNDVLGFGYQEYVASIRSLAISRPADYFTLRRTVLQKVKTDAVGELYKTLFNVLSTGTDVRGSPIALLGTGVYKPRYPSQKINDFCIQVASDLADHINRAIDIILPEDFDKIATGKLSLKARGGVIE